MLTTESAGANIVRVFDSKNLELSYFKTFAMFTGIKKKHFGPTCFHYLIPQRSELWFVLRRHRVTASNASTLLSRTTTNLKDFLDKVNRPIPRTRSMVRGSDLEASGLKFLCMKANAIFYSAGILIRGQLACSPDGINHTTRKIAEVKCFEIDAHHDLCEYIKLNRSLPPEIMKQVQLQLYISGAVSCWFCAFHPMAKSEVIEIFPDAHYRKQIGDKLRQLKIAP